MTVICKLIPVHVRPPSYFYLPPSSCTLHPESLFRDEAFVVRFPPHPTALQDPAKKRFIFTSHFASLGKNHSEQRKVLTSLAKTEKQRCILNIFV